MLISLASVKKNQKNKTLGIIERIQDNNFILSTN